MHNRIPEEVIEDVQKSNNILDVVGEYVQLKKQGKNYVGLCPFHQENTPSFSVTPEKQMFYCFGCKKGGNVFSFLMELENYTFVEAVELLARRGGVELPKSNYNKPPVISPEKQSILSAYEWVSKFYHHLLKYTDHGKEGLKYLNDRGITSESIDQFKLGYAPNVSDLTANFLNKRGFHQQLLVKGGLLNLLKDNTTTDPFRGRVVFPIRNHLGKTVAFGGRSIDGQEPKYLNSSENELFQKSRILFNFDLAKRHIRKKREAILLEGQMDVISAYQENIRNVIATLGTALTESQAKLLKRYVETVIICYDGDHAGLEASYKASSLLRNVGCEVRVANLPKGMDPDLFIKTYGADAFNNQIIKASDTYIGFYMRYIKQNYNMDIESDRLAYIQVLIKEISMIESAIEREHYLKDLSDEFDLSLESLIQEVNTERQKTIPNQQQSIPKRSINRAPVKRKQKRLMPAYQNAERKLIAYMLQDQFIAEKVRNDIGVDFNIDDHKVIVTHLYAFYEEGQSPNISLFIDRLRDEHLKQLVIELSMILAVSTQVDDEEINDYLKLIRSQTDDNARIKAYKEKQQLALQQNDPIKAAYIAMDILNIERQLKNHN